MSRIIPCNLMFIPFNLASIYEYECVIKWFTIVYLMYKAVSRLPAGRRPTKRDQMQLALKTQSSSWYKAKKEG